MTKERFFKFCRTHDATQGVELIVGSRREHLGLNHIVILDGCWANCSITEVELYRPMPGNQWDDWRERDRRIDKEEAKFKKWLEEWKKGQAQ